MQYAIEVNNLTKEFISSKILSSLLSHPFNRKKVIIAVNNVNLQIKRGEAFGLIGPNGAGKTTFIKLLCCLILPTKGTANVFGYDIIKDEEKIKATVGLVSGDERNFYWRLTGRQNLCFFAGLYNLSSKGTRQKIKELSLFLGIEEELDKRFDSYSTGMKQRLSIARCLINDPQILFMDEPTKSLDPPTVQNLRVFIKDKLVNEQKKTVVFTTHNLNEAESLADRLAIMNEGIVRAYGTIAELRNKMGNVNATTEEIFGWFIKIKC